jgi:hypothetical protein
MREKGVKKTTTSKGLSKAKVRAKANGPTKIKVKSKPPATERTRAQVESPPPPANPIELSERTWERIAKKAYELYEQRGRGEGRALEDWLKAEEIVMEEIREARE